MLQKPYKPKAGKHYQPIAHWLLERLRGSAFISLLVLLSQLGIFGFALTYIWEIDERNAQRLRQGWELLASASGKPGNLGRGEAIRMLVASGQELQRLDMRKAHLQSEEFLLGTKFYWTDFTDASLDGATLNCAKFRMSDLTDTNFTKAKLDGADLSRTTMKETNFRGADLTDAILKGAIIDGVKFKRATLDRTRLEGVDLSKANGLTVEQVSRACVDDDTKYPDYLKSCPSQIDGYYCGAKVTDIELRTWTDECVNDHRPWYRF